MHPGGDDIPRGANDDRVGGYAEGDPQSTVAPGDRVPRTLPRELPSFDVAPLPLNGNGNRMGAPALYSPERAKRLCTIIATTPRTLKQACEETGLAVMTVMSWLTRYPDFAEAYARAREYQCEIRADECLDIADNSTNDWVDYETKAGRVIRQFDYEHSRRSELRIKTRQWLMEKYGRRRFGDRLEVQSVQLIQNVSGLSEPARIDDANTLIARVRSRLAAAAEDGELIEGEAIDEETDSARE